MKSSSLRLILFVILFVGFGSVHCDQPNESATTSDIIPKARQLVENFLNRTENKLIPGLVISVSVKGEQKWLEAFGTANIENNVPMTGDSVMQIGSITKSFIVALASRLMQENKLDFDAPIRQYLTVEEFPDKKWNGNLVNITLQQLFQMTVGIPNNDNELEFGKCLRCTKQIEHLIFMRDKELDFEPGTNLSYSNYGYELAGAVIETVLENKTLDVAVKDMIDNVLKLNKTAIYDSHVITPHIASFYSVNNNSGLSNSGMWGNIFLNELHAAGGIISTMTDLAKYGQIWLDAYKGRSEHFLQQPSAKRAWTPSNLYPYGMGWEIQNNIAGNRPSGNQVVWHDGGTFGCNSMLAIYPEPEIIVATSSNLGESDVGAWILEGTVADLFARSDALQSTT